MLLRRRWLYGLLLIPFLTLLSIAASVRAQGQSSSLSILEVDDSQYPLVKALVAVADANGIPVHGLTKEAFLVTEDGDAAEIFSVQEVSDASTLNLVLAIDVSGSMEGAPIDATRQAAMQLLQNLPPQDKVALLLFNEKVHTAAPLGTPREDVLNALQNMQSKGDTALYDAIHQGAMLLQQAPSGRRAVVVFSDGADTRSSLKLEDAVNTAQRFSVPVYVVGYGPKIKPKELQRIASLTGGAFYQAPKIQDIPVAFAQVMDALHRSYEIQYIGVTPVDGREHELRVVLVQGQSVETSAVFIARPGNLTVQMDIENAPDRALAEQLLQAAGQPPVDAHIPIVGGSVTLKMLTKPGHVAHVVYQLDGDPLGETDNTRFVWDTTSASPGVHTLSAMVTDHVGNEKSYEQQVAIVPAASIQLVLPPSGKALEGDAPLSLQVNAIAPIAEVIVGFQGQELARFTGPPYDFTWSTVKIPPGDYTLEVTAILQDGSQISKQLPVTIGPHITVVLKSPQSGEELKGGVQLKADVKSDAKVKHVIFYADGQELGKVENPPYTFKIHTGDFLPGTYVLRAEAENIMGMKASDEVQVQMIPVTRTSALGIALLLMLAVLIIVPIIFMARKRRKQREQAQSEWQQSPPAGESGVFPGNTSTSQRQPVAWLTLISGEADGNQFPIYPGETRVGRSREFADVRLSDLSASRRHAIITADAQGVFYQDLNSQNPSFINGQPVAQRVRLHHGDEIQIGNTKLLFQQTGG